MPDEMLEGAEGEADESPPEILCAVCGDVVTPDDPGFYDGVSPRHKGCRALCRRTIPAGMYNAGAECGHPESSHQPNCKRCGWCGGFLDEEGEEDD